MWKKINLGLMKGFYLNMFKVILNPKNRRWGMMAIALYIWLAYILLLKTCWHPSSQVLKSPRTIIISHNTFFWSAKALDKIAAKFQKKLLQAWVLPIEGRWPTFETCMCMTKEIKIFSNTKAIVSSCIRD